MGERLTILLGMWSGWRPMYTVKHVNAISRMLREYLKIPYKLVLLTDENAKGAQVDEIRPLPKDPDNLLLIQKVNCFRRLRYFDPEFNRSFGTEWIMSLDLDTLIRADITDMVLEAMDNPFGFWILKSRYAGRKATERPYNGAIYGIRAGEHSNVWTSFNPQVSPVEIKKLRYAGSDQAWISIALPGAPVWGPEQGVYFFGQYNQCRAPEAKIINFAGSHTKPWSNAVRHENKSIYKEYMSWLNESVPTTLSA